MMNRNYFPFATCEKAVFIFAIVVGGFGTASCGSHGSNRTPQPTQDVTASQPAQEESLVAKAKKVLGNVADQYRGGPRSATTVGPKPAPGQQAPAVSDQAGGDVGSTDTSQPLSLDPALLEQVERQFKALQDETVAKSTADKRSGSNDSTRKARRSRTQAYDSTDAPAPTDTQPQGARQSPTQRPQAFSGVTSKAGFPPFTPLGGTQNLLGIPLQPGQSLEQLNQFLSANLQAGNELIKHLNMGALRLLAKKGGGPSSTEATQLITLYEVMALGQDASKSWKEGGKLKKVEAVARILIAMAVLYESRKDFINKNTQVAGNLFAMQSIINERSQIQQAILNTQLGNGSTSPETINALQTLQAAYSTQQRSFNNWLNQSQLDRAQVVDYAIKTAAGTGPQAASAVMRGALITDQGAAAQALRNLPGMSSSKLTALQAQNSNLIQPASMQAPSAGGGPVPTTTQYSSANSGQTTSAQPSPGAYNQLPPAERTEVGKGGAGAGTITVSNQTDYQMEISFSGPSSAQAMIPAHGSRTLNLSEGSYQINARLPGRPSVRPFQGSDFYRSTERYSLPLYLVSQPRQ